MESVDQHDFEQEYEVREAKSYHSLFMPIQWKNQRRNLHLKELLDSEGALLSTSHSPAPTHSASTTTKPSFRLTLLVSSLLPFIIMPGPNNAKWGNGSHYCVITLTNPSLPPSSGSSSPSPTPTPTTQSTAG
ncbi:hypothetical protein PCASD_23034 [Puccinia coronata f. sp. avenae]|uniref:Uncharacterized protein n=1 Tax=Puccinia coronata f. sp. avenae TaxID=200324 RepID=A0A2N5TNA0_9BASI|nr:hypothetical protein PCASD_25470 [Puccinia coronata f. sp. avenae]PLW26975.1 hypothetical protein PCASD_23034 [Puccinia coronata f. sp. avenae]